MSEAALLALRPRFASAILSGVKTVEVRRRAPRLASGALLLLYAGVPIRSVVGTALLTAVDAACAAELWDLYGHATALERDEFDTYLSGSASPACVLLEDVSSIEPIALPFAPPQSWMRLRPSDRDHAQLLDALSHHRTARSDEDPWTGTDHPSIFWASCSRTA